MILLVLLIFLYSIAYLVVYVLAHQDANLIKPLTGMTAGMLFLLTVTAIACLLYNLWYISIIIFIVIIGLLRFLFFLTKY